ncbi:hypothetical protein AJ88_03165 [Mesorhizobium amorphae CCBAU 01583]|nr:hypothetical protein AJ88_03165 [Mesorhizobium amorphae CCBAU 01583]
MDADLLLESYVVHDDSADDGFRAGIWIFLRSFLVGLRRGRPTIVFSFAGRVPFRVEFPQRLLRSADHGGLAPARLGHDRRPQSCRLDKVRVERLRLNSKRSADCNRGDRNRGQGGEALRRAFASGLTLNPSVEHRGQTVGRERGEFGRIVLREDVDGFCFLNAINGRNFWLGRRGRHRSPTIVDIFRKSAGAGFISFANSRRAKASGSTACNAASVSAFSSSLSVCQVPGPSPSANSKNRADSKAVQRNPAARAIVGNDVVQVEPSPKAGNWSPAI